MRGFYFFPLTVFFILGFFFFLLLLFFSIQIGLIGYAYERMGIAVPLFVPPLIAAAAGLLLAPDHAPALAYIAGTMGCLIGADLLNLHRLSGLGAPVASIGGAGTFDGIFFTGIIAVLLT